ncbi:uncharacterized protein [Solanum tuberosum]|uniref:uncharacterized protein n=1 Tax=Solanum tuberosum TaxID=4113 RepID=UPI00073A3753|nr:PREDICTED: uncharacterized protein LOC107062210 [Solanum tuberosum]
MINKAIFWNIRSVRTQKAFERLVDLHKIHHYSYIALLEPFQSPSELETYRRKLGLPNARVNSSAKNWVFWENGWVETDSTDTCQQLTMKYQLRGTDDKFTVTTVYARCSALERLELWEDLENIVDHTISPWLVGGDFNTIIDESEKLGGLLVTNQETADFASCISACSLNELKFVGSCYTWWNGRIEYDCIFKRLDRVFGNNDFMQLLPNSEVHPLIRQGSDHTPLHVICNALQEQVVKPFRSLLSKAEADLKRYRHIEEEYWRQKAGMKWYTDGDKNTKFFHAYVKGKRRKLHIKEIHTRQGDIISRSHNIVEEAVNVFKEQFMENQEWNNVELLQCIPKLVTDGDNEEMETMPTKEEVKHVVFSLNGDSASGPDGFSGQFFQSCWDTIGTDITNMVKAFFLWMGVAQICDSH